MAPYRSILITGGQGMLGRTLAEAATRRGHAATAIGRGECDVTSTSDVARVFAERRPTLLFNCAGHTLVDQCEREPERADAINGRAVGNLASASRAHGTMLVHFSTDFVFDGQCDRPYRESDPPRPLSAYGRSKLLGEGELTRNAPDRWLLLRTAWLFGRHGTCFPRTIVERGRAGYPLRVVNDQIGSPTFAEDLAEAVFDLIDAGAGGVWHAANSGAVSWRDFAAAAVAEFGIAAQVEPISTADWAKVRPNLAVRPAYSALDCAKLTEKLGRSMSPWRDALATFRARVDAAGTF